MVAPPPTQLVARLLPHPPPNPSQTHTSLGVLDCVFKSRYSALQIQPLVPCIHVSLIAEHAQCMYNRLSSMLQT